jgi:adenine-specific DNA-methyltransferase
MAKQLQKLELTWIGKGNEPKLEPRILIEDPSKSFGDPKSENMLIHGDNLLALKALEQQFAGKIKCIYIDPPYNTGSRIDADGEDVGYEDGIEHSEWLSMMKPRIELLRNLLHADGTLAVQIDDNEFARLYLLILEIFKNEKNLKVICLKMSEATGPKMAHVINSGRIPKLKEYIIIARKNGIRDLYVEKIPKEKWDKEYKTVCLNISKKELEKVKEVLDNDERTEEEIIEVNRLLSKIKFENANIVCEREFGTKATDTWMFENAYRIIQVATLTGGARDLAERKKLSFDENKIPPAFSILTPNNKMYAIKGDFNTATDLPRCKILFADKYLTVHPGDFWQDIKTTGLDNEGGVTFKKGKKPEALLKRIIGMSTDEGDLVLDSFLGSGTTAAVAHKMKRRWIGIEMGPHCISHSLPRVSNVIKGVDKQGVTEILNWQGGGGFKFYNLAPSLVQKDKYGTEIINPQYNANMLAAAMAKQEGFRYQPDENNYWKQGMSSEKDFIFTTTQFVTVAMLDKLTEELKPGESLLVCCKSFAKGCANRHTNITIKKIPQMLLGRCEFGKDDYSFNIVNLPHNDDTDIEIEDSEESEAPKHEKKTKAKKQKDDDTQSSLF